MANPFAVVVADILSRQHLDAYVAIVIAYVLAGVGLYSSVRIEILAAGILMIMSFIVRTAVDGRHRLIELLQSVDSHRSNSLLKFADFPDAALRPQLRAASEMSLSGLTFHRFFPLYGYDIE